MSKLQIISVSGVRGYVDASGTVHLNAEDVARGLGFVQTQEKISPTSGGKTTYTSIRWERVNGYLKSFGFSQEVAKDDFIPENMFYRLAMKANNEAAQVFQAKVADKILPSIRKTGMYINPNAPINPDLLIKIGHDMKELAAQRDAALAQVAQLKPKADYTDAVLESDEKLTSELIAKEYGECAQWLHTTLGKLGKIFKRGRTWFMRAPYAKAGYRTSETLRLERGKTVVNHYWTQKGRWFIYNTLKEQGILPTDERKNIMATLL